MKNNYRIDDRGFSLIEIIIAIGIMSVLSAGALQLFDYMSKERARNEIIMSLQMTRNKLYSYVEDQDAWNKIISSNSGLGCLKSGSTSPCTSGAVINTVIYDQSGKAVYNTSTQGYNRRGETCLISDANCAFQFVITTTLTCQTGLTTCVNPSVMTRGQVKILNPSAALNIPTPNYSFESAKGANPSGTSSSADLAYSSNCSDWSSIGWKSKSACLQDGRWHMVYSATSTGSALFGSVSDLNSHLEAGANIKVVLPGFSSEECASVIIVAPVIKCLTNYRRSGNAPAEITHGSASYSTDGSLWCSNLGNERSGVNACTISLPIKWFIRY